MGNIVVLQTTTTPSDTHTQKTTQQTVPGEGIFVHGYDVFFSAFVMIQLLTKTTAITLPKHII